METRFEQSEFLEAVGEIFRRVDRPYIARIAASGTPDDVQKAVAECVRERVGL
jgi:thymidylate kinase